MNTFSSCVCWQKIRIDETQHPPQTAISPLLVWHISHNTSITKCSIVFLFPFIIGTNNICIVEIVMAQEQNVISFHPKFVNNLCFAVVEVVWKKKLFKWTVTFVWFWIVEHIFLPCFNEKLKSVFNCCFEKIRHIHCSYLVIFFNAKKKKTNKIEPVKENRTDLCFFFSHFPFAWDFVVFPQIIPFQTAHILCINTVIFTDFWVFLSFNYYEFVIISYIKIIKHDYFCEMFAINVHFYFYFFHFLFFMVVIFSHVFAPHAHNHIIHVWCFVS